MPADKKYNEGVSRRLLIANYPEKLRGRLSGTFPRHITDTAGDLIHRFLEKATRLQVFPARLMPAFVPEAAIRRSSGSDPDILFTSFGNIPFIHRVFDFKASVSDLKAGF